MRILMTALAPSHLLCMVPLAWAARAAGHDVLVAGRADVAATAREAGLHAADVAVVPVDRLRPRGSRPFPAHGWRHPWEIRVDQVLDGCLAAARRWRPDLVVCDPIEFCGMVVAGLLDVPVVVQRWGGPDAMSGQAIDQARTVMSDFCADLGLPSPGLPAPALTIDPCPPGLRFDTVTPGVPMRFVPYNGRQSVTGWVGRATGRRRVCVTFGLFGGKAAVRGADGIRAGEFVARLEAVVAALARRPGLDVVLTAPADVRNRLTGLPRWFRVVDRAPLDTVLADCALVVHHGGTGTAMTACAHGVPQLVLPPEHPALATCADGLVRGRAARRLDGEEQVAQEALGRELDVLLDSDAYRERAGELAAEIAAQPSPARVVPLLEAVR